MVATGRIVACPDDDGLKGGCQAGIRKLFNGTSDQVMAR